MPELTQKKREELAIQMITLFDNLTPEDFDDVVTEAKKQITLKVEQKRENELCNLFERQIETLRSRNCPQAILTLFANHRAEVIKKTLSMDIPEDHIPFLLVIPRSYLGVYGLMSMICNGDEAGYTNINPNEIINQVKAPEEVYAIYDVEDGNGTIGKSTENAEKIIRLGNRFCLTFEEGVALSIHSKALSKHSINCIGSNLKGEIGGVMCIYLDTKNRPSISWVLSGSSNAECGSASCGSRT